MKSNNIKNIIKEDLLESIRIKENCLDTLIGPINKACIIILNSIKNKGKIILCGNGGSAADAQHIAAELIGRFKKEREPIPAIALNVNTSILTAISNDYNFEYVFERQVEAIMDKKDVLIGISTSGKSKNIIRALIKAKEIGGKTISLTGIYNAEMKNYSDLIISVPSKNTPRIQEMHIQIGHILCNVIDSQFPNPTSSSLSS